MEKRDLYMPVNAPDAEDVIQGVGVHELYIYTIGFCVCVMLGLWFYSKIKSSLLALTLSIFVFSLVVLVFRRDLFNENLIKKISIIRNFFRGQRKFEYSYHNIYEASEGIYEDDYES